MATLSNLRMKMDCHATKVARRFGCGSRNCERSEAIHLLVPRKNGLPRTVRCSQFRLGLGGGQECFEIASESAAIHLAFLKNGYLYKGGLI